MSKVWEHIWSNKGKYVSFLAAMAAVYFAYKGKDDIANQIKIVTGRF